MDDSTRPIPPRVRHAPPPPLEHEEELEAEDERPRRSYRDLVKGRESLLKVLRDCRTKESMQPLHTYRDQLGATQVEERERIERVMKVLGLASK